MPHIRNQGKCSQKKPLEQLWMNLRQKMLHINIGMQCTNNYNYRTSAPPFTQYQRLASYYFEYFKMYFIFQ